jgi:hypothetical protein
MTKFLLLVDVLLLSSSWTVPTAIALKSLSSHIWLTGMTISHSKHTSAMTSSSAPPPPLGKTRVYKTSPATRKPRWTTNTEILSSSSSSSSSSSIDDSTVPLKFHKRIQVNYQLMTISRWLKSMQLRYLWIAPLFLWWYMVVPRMVASATMTATTSTTPVQFQIEPREEFARASTSKHVAASTVNEENRSTEQHPGPVVVTTNNNDIRQRIRFITGSAVMLTTALVGAGRVNRRERTNSDIRKSLDDCEVSWNDLFQQNGSDQPNQEQHELTWLFPQKSPDRNESTKPTDMRANAIYVPTTPFLSSRSNTDKGTNVVTSRKSTSKLVNGNKHAKKFPSTVNNHQKFPSSLNSRMLQRLQQPKPPKEEARLQAKYAAIESLEERAFTILVDLGMVELSDPLDTIWE